MELKPQEEKSNEQEPSKRPYQAPQLLVYGSIHEITRNLGSVGDLDNAGGAGGPPKTGVN